MWKRSIAARPKDTITMHHYTFVKDQRAEHKSTTGCNPPYLVTTEEVLPLDHQCNVLNILQEWDPVRMNSHRSDVDPIHSSPYWVSFLLSARSMRARKGSILRWNASLHWRKRFARAERCHIRTALRCRASFKFDGLSTMEQGR